MPVEDEKNLTRGGNQTVRQHLQSSASQTEGLSETAPEKKEEIVKALQAIHVELMQHDAQPWVTPVMRAVKAVIAIVGGAA